MAIYCIYESFSSMFVMNHIYREPRMQWNISESFGVFNAIIQPL